MTGKGQDFVTKVTWYTFTYYLETKHRITSQNKTLLSLNKSHICISQYHGTAFTVNAYI